MTLIKRVWSGQHERIINTRRHPTHVTRAEFEALARTVDGLKEDHAHLQRALRIAGEPPAA